MKKEYNIALIPGDGTGPEVLAEGIKVVMAASNKFGFSLNFTPYDLGGERYKKQGRSFPTVLSKN
jgi:3-isopropylmalate dehydrogenase